MKRLFASITVLTLILAACSHSGSDENEKNDDSSKKEQKEKKSKTDSKDKSKIIKIKTVHLNLVVIIMNFRRLIHQLKILIHQNSNLNLTKIIVKIRTMLHLISNHATQVARSLSPFNGNEGQALQQLPNFETALDIAKNEANMFGNSHKNIMTTPSRLLMMDLDMYLALKMTQKTIVIR